MQKVSVIIPIYNSEIYLEKCLDSVFSQTLSDIEIICINDNSTDNSIKILEKYRSKIRLSNLSKNIGPSRARNFGIELAQGEYIAFLDSDDFFDKKFLEKLYSKAIQTEADCVKGDIYNYDSENNTVLKTKFYDMNSKIKENWAYFYYGFTSAIYRRSFLQEKGIKFPENIKYFEDPYFSIQAALHYKNLQIIDSANYYYRKHADSLSENLDPKDLCDSIWSILQQINKTTVNPEHYLIVFDFLYEVLLNSALNSTNKELCIEKLIQIISNCKDPFARKKYSENARQKFNQKVFLKFLRSGMLAERR